MLTSSIIQLVEENDDGRRKRRLGGRKRRMAGEVEVLEGGEVEVLAGAREGVEVEEKGAERDEGGEGGRDGAGEGVGAEAFSLLQELCGCLMLSVELLEAFDGLADVTTDLGELLGAEEEGGDAGDDGQLGDPSPKRQRQPWHLGVGSTGRLREESDEVRVLLLRLVEKKSEEDEERRLSQVEFSYYHGTIKGGAFPVIMLPCCLIYILCSPPALAFTILSLKIMNV